MQREMEADREKWSWYRTTEFLVLLFSRKDKTWN